MFRTADIHIVSVKSDKHLLPIPGGTYCYPDKTLKQTSTPRCLIKKGLRRMGDYCFFAVVLCLTSFRQVGQAFNGCHAAGGENLNAIFHTHFKKPPSQLRWNWSSDSPSSLPQLIFFILIVETITVHSAKFSNNPRIFYSLPIISANSVPKLCQNDKNFWKNLVFLRKKISHAVFKLAMSRIWAILKHIKYYI